MGIDLAPKGTYRQSMLKSFQKCPGYYQRRYLHGDESPLTTIEKYMGHVVHNTLEMFYEHLKQTPAKLPTLAQVHKKYQLMWKEEWDGDLIQIVHLPTATPEQRAKKTAKAYFQLGLECLTKYYSRNYPFDDEIVLANELEIEFELDGWTIAGRLDRLGQHKQSRAIRVHDYKTGSTKPSSAARKVDMQLTFYEEGVRRMIDAGAILVPGLEPGTEAQADFEQILHFVRHDISYVAARTQGEIDLCMARTVEVIEEIEDAEEMDHFPFRPNHLCLWCEFCGDCDAFQENLEQRAGVAA